MDSSIPHPQHLHLHRQSQSPTKTQIPPSSSTSSDDRSSVGTSDTSFASHPEYSRYSSHQLTQPTDTFPTFPLPATSHSNRYSASHAYSQPQRNSKHRNPSLTSAQQRSRAQSSASSVSTSSVRRKPLPANASPLATRFSTGDYLVGNSFQTLNDLPELPEPTYPRPYSIDSPTLHEFPPTSKLDLSEDSLLLDFSDDSFVDNPTDRIALADLSSGSPTLVANSANNLANLQQIGSPDSPNKSIPPSLPLDSYEYTAKHASLTTDSALTSAASDSTGTWYSHSSSTSQSPSLVSMFSPKATPPHNLNSPNGISRSFTNESLESNTTISKSRPKSPGGSKLGTFFGWGRDSTTSDNPTSEAYSPIPSPQPIDNNFADASRSGSKQHKPNAIDVPKANADAGYVRNSYLQIPLATPTTPLQIEEMEAELKEISAELASSIRREMDLEDLVERLQIEAQNAQNPNGKRTSDYFSDSGTSSVKYGGESDARQDELDRMMRKTQQDKAQMRLELTEKVQEERNRRKVLETQIRTLEEKALQVDIASINSVDTTGRLKDLEKTCEDLRRRLAEEKQVKDNFEDLLTALKAELESSHNERDNLRDEIVPQLRARVEGLEAQAAEHEKLTYEQSKMQQELQTLKTENMTLANAQQNLRRFGSISEEAPSMMNPRASMGLGRSNSVAQGMISRTRPPSLARSSSVKVTESREALAERVKDIELQRDALHRAMKSLLERQEHQNRENQKKIRQLEMERDRAMSDSPRRLGYDREVANLREEINALRRRADEAIEQKWQCEKGLSGLKMDLDRAEQEIGSLRTLLQEHDILIPMGGRPRSNGSPDDSHITSEGLENAYKDLQKAYAESLNRIQKLESSEPMSEETSLAMKQLERSLATAVAERDIAKQEVDSLRDEAISLRSAEKDHAGEELALSEQLRASANRVEELAKQVREQLSANTNLRRRLAETVERGEKEQKMNASKIMLMQGKLKVLEEQLMVAQQASEEKLSTHEEEIRELKSSHNIQLSRMKTGLQSPRSFGPKSPLSPLFAGSTKMPRIMSTSSGKAMTVSEDSKMEFLKQRVMDLERALADADREMEEVVGRMNVAQIEVMELQNEREEAQRETRRLQKAIEAEKLQAFEGKFATLAA
ncbi:hypothetical protein HYFRA_00004970 [Hymenoscyphus fraxineus]|uniref:DUF7603 domain-containing protein n=1 Tax=Hymenoscyphus fraxineus TaxID=746836 RepID=A0A9N9KL84_9HELO|nr:hypothetical protein HYFRA_00004970 [Hymenoscyphus fraxineus]